MKTFDCQCAEAPALPPDPRKHVNYTQGMVLGVDDLIQEFTYHQNQRQCLARDTIGYGTLSGLCVTFRKDLKVSVAPGTALSPRGQLIRVAPEQCAGINDWLDLADTKEKIKSLGNAFNVYAVLCFRDCQVDELPVPGEPCRCEDQAMAPSRILDDFRLELRLTPPAQREEDAVRDFVQWLRQIKASEAAAGSSSLDNFLDAIRGAAQDRSSPLESPPDFFYGSPPENVIIPAAQLCEYLRAALKLWVVELRPVWQAQWAGRVGGGCGCHGDEQAKGQDAEECLLLAALTVTLTGGRVVNDNDVVVDDSRRPFVVHLRMLQEMLLCGPCCGGGGGCNDRTFATVFALDDHTLRIWIHHPMPITFGSDAVQLEIDDNPVTGFTVTQAASGESPPGGLNVFDLDLGTSPLQPLERGNRVELKFYTHLLTEVGSPSRTLAEAQAADGWCYPEEQDGVVTARSIADLTGAVTAPPPLVIPQPSNSMPAAESFGVLGTAGDPTTTEYARADHVHPMPPPPAVPQPATVAPAPESFGTPPNVGVSADYARADHVHQMPPLPAIPQPAIVPPSPENFGAAPIVGVSVDYARADHVHQMPAPPAVPQPATVVPGDENFGAAPIVGVSVDYARADHVHQMPPPPAVPQPATIDPADENFGAAPNVGVSADYARADHVHRMPALNAVEHPPGLPQYLIVAAGIVSGALDPATGAVIDDSRKPVYNGLAVKAIFTGGFRINFKGYSPPNGKFQIIVKALPVGRDDKQIVIVNFGQFRVDGIDLIVSRAGGDLFNIQEIANLEFMIEISRFAIS